MNKSRFFKRSYLIFWIANIFTLSTISPSAISAPQTNREAVSRQQQGLADIVAFWSLMQRMDKNLRGMHALHSDMKSKVDSMLTSSCDEIVPLLANARALRDEARASADDPGLDLELGASNSLANNNGTLATQTGNQNAYVGLRWDLLRSGWKQNKNTAQWLENNANIADIRARMEYEQRLNKCRADKVHLGFLPLRATLLRYKVDLLRILWRLQLRSYLSGNSFFDSTLAIEQELQVASNSLARLQPELAELPTYQTTSVMSPPILDMDIQLLLSAIERNPTLRQLAELDKTSIKKKNEKKEQDRLTVSLRYEASGTNFQRNGLAGAVHYTMPLFEDTDSGLIERTMAVDDAASSSAAQRIRDTQHANAKFNDERELTLRQWYRYQRVMERVRRSLLDERFDPNRVDTSAAAQRAMEAIDSAIELAQAKELLYQRAAEVISTSELLYEPDFVKLAIVVNNAYRGRSGARSLYLWSKTFNAYPNDFLMSFLRSKGINTVLLSASSLANDTKRQAFIVAAKANHLRVEMLFGNNNWLKETKYSKAVEQIILHTSADKVLKQLAKAHNNYEQTGEKHPVAIQSLDDHTAQIEQKSNKPLLLGSGMIHLDIEPQAVARYKGHPEQIQSVYLGLLTYLHTHLPDEIKVSVSLPTNWRPETYAKIADIVDQIYIMNYGSPKLERILRHLNSVRSSVSDSKLTLVLRTNDFSNEAELEQVFDTVSQQTSIRHFAIHAAGTYLNLSSQQANSVITRIVPPTRNTK